MVRKVWPKFLWYALALLVPPAGVFFFSRFDAFGAALLGGWAGVVAAMACTVRIVRDAQAKGWQAALLYVGVGMVLCALSLATTYISFCMGLRPEPLY